jgi:Mg-chelatase subunit ChlD
VSAARDEMRGTRSQRVYERKHEVHATLHRGWAELRVRRTVENLGSRHDQAVFWISPPPSAVATGLRTLGSLGGRPKWFAGELLEAEAAAKKYTELTGVGGAYPKDPALLSWRSQDQLLLQVFPVPPNDLKSIEYTFVVPASYQAGAHRFRFDAFGTGEHRATLTLAAAARGDRLLLDGETAPAGVRIVRAPGDAVELGLRPETREPIGGEVAVAPTGTRFVTRFSVEAAPRVAEVPRNADIVVVLDASRSVSTSALEAQKAAAAAYLSHFSNARVEIVTFDRTPHRRYGRLVPVERARRDLMALPIEQRNGSAVDAALSEAEGILAAGARGRARRLVLVSDGIVRSGLKPERIRAAVGASGAIVHLGVLTEGSVSLSRDDGHAWAPALRRTGGLVWRAGARADAGSATVMRTVYEEWARPRRIDHLRLYSPDLELGALSDVPTQLDEGDGWEQLLFTGRDVSWLRAEGELWATPVRRVLHADGAAGERWAALVFGSPLLHELSEPEMMKLAMRGGAVSPVTSYLAIEPGVRPSTEGLDWSSAGTGRGAGVPRVRMGATQVSGHVAPLDREKWLRDTLRPALLACGGKPDTASVSLETTHAEVADVTRVGLVGPRDALLERCLTEAVWDLTLPVAFTDEWTVWTVDV